MAAELDIEFSHVNNVPNKISKQKTTFILFADYKGKKYTTQIDDFTKLQRPHPRITHENITDELHFRPRKLHESRLVHEDDTKIVLHLHFGPEVYVVFTLNVIEPEPTPEPEIKPTPEIKPKPKPVTAEKNLKPVSKPTPEYKPEKLLVKLFSVIPSKQFKLEPADIEPDLKSSAESRLSDAKFVKCKFHKDHILVEYTVRSMNDVFLIVENLRAFDLVEHLNEMTIDKNVICMACDRVYVKEKNVNNKEENKPAEDSAVEEDEEDEEEEDSTVEDDKEEPVEDEEDSSEEDQDEIDEKAAMEELEDQEDLQIQEEENGLDKNSALKILTELVSLDQEIEDIRAKFEEMQSKQEKKILKKLLELGTRSAGNWQEIKQLCETEKGQYDIRFCEDGIYWYNSTGKEYHFNGNGHRMAN